MDFRSSLGLFNFSRKQGLRLCVNSLMVIYCWMRNWHAYENARNSIFGETPHFVQNLLKHSPDVISRTKGYLISISEKLGWPRQTVIQSIPSWNSRHDETQCKKHQLPTSPYPVKRSVRYIGIRNQRKNHFELSRNAYSTTETSNKPKNVRSTPSREIHRQQG